MKNVVLVSLFIFYCLVYILDRTMVILGLDHDLPAEDWD